MVMQIKLVVVVNVRLVVHHELFWRPNVLLDHLSISVIKLVRVYTV